MSVASEMESTTVANTQPTLNGIKNSWSLKDFYKSHGKMKIAHMVNKDTGELFDSLAFVNPTNGSTVFVNFSSKMGPLTSAQINEMRNDLQVAELNVAPELLESRRASGRQLESYSLCRKGAGAWEDVSIDEWE